MADVPAGVGAPTQYGPGLRGLAHYLLAGQYLPLARTAELLNELVGAPISQGSLVRWYADAAGGLDRFEDALRAGLAGSGVLGADETGMRVAGALAWVHAARTDDLTRYTVSTKRGVEAMTEAGVLPALSPRHRPGHRLLGPVLVLRRHPRRVWSTPGSRTRRRRRGPRPKRLGRGDGPATD